MGQLVLNIACAPPAFFAKLRAMMEQTDIQKADVKNTRIAYLGSYPLNVENKDGRYSLWYGYASGIFPAGMTLCNHEFNFTARQAADGVRVEGSIRLRRSMLWSTIACLVALIAILVFADGSYFLVIPFITLFTWLFAEYRLFKKRMRAVIEEMGKE